MGGRVRGGVRGRVGWGGYSAWLKWRVKGGWVIGSCQVDIGVIISIHLSGLRGVSEGGWVISSCQVGWVVVGSDVLLFMVVIIVIIIVIIIVNSRGVIWVVGLVFARNQGSSR